MHLVESILSSDGSSFVRTELKPAEINNMNEYKAGFPLFACSKPEDTFLRLNPHTFLQIDITDENLVTPAFIPGAIISKELFDLSDLDTEILRYLTFPKLRIYIGNLARLFLESNQSNYMIAALAHEIVDGIDLDMVYFDDDASTFEDEEQRSFAEDLVSGKQSRLGFDNEWLSACVKDSSEREVVRRIAGV